MKARNCCQTMEMELTAWKAIIYVIMRRMEKLQGADKAKFLPNIEDIHILVEEMDGRIEEIRDQCTPETGIDDIRTEKEEFDKTMAVARVKVEDAIQYLGAGNFGG
jgi:hypothetical protein